MPRLRSVLAALLIFLSPAVALGVQPDEVLDDPALEQRARDLSAELRCMVCQNQSIDDSDASLARDLRLLVRERLKAGDTNDEVIDYLVDRYGEFVLLKPRVSGRNLILWATPVVVLLIGGAAFFAYGRRRERVAGPVALTAEEEERLARLLDEQR